jgi:hypothetical protein
MYLSVYREPSESNDKLNLSYLKSKFGNIRAGVAETNRGSMVNPGE